MAIVAVEAVPYALPFREPYVTARGTLKRREMVLLRLRDDDGLEGLGEAVPLSLRGGATLADVHRELSESGGELRDGLSPPARAAVEMALLDIEAKRTGQPVWQLLGATEAAPVPCNATLTAGEPEAVATQATAWAERGFTTLKLKVGTAGDVAQVAAVREAVGPRARVRVDANGAWTPPEGVLRLAAMENYGIELAEQPAAGLEELALVRAQTAIPIAADESIATPEQAGRAVALGACALATVKLAKCGGIAPALAIAGELPTYLTSALDGPVGIAAAAHAAQRLRDAGDAGVAHGLATQLLFAATIADVGCELSGNSLHLPDGPGLGVVIDEQALDRHRL